MLYADSHASSLHLYIVRRVVQWRDCPPRISYLASILHIHLEALIYHISVFAYDKIKPGRAIPGLFRHIRNPCICTIGASF